ncbi:DUF998 domain-containing protein [Glycomyces buryatensis]|uniref:DUF998 domain-containing protein n=1 Tax=Glycomyces buryatensis TaxID=2570927 RepID=A0A4S8QCX2_9ACTN|nr:DUF998 domain-containing protein [Glycomyces buryatensis]
MDSGARVTALASVSDESLVMSSPAPLGTPDKLLNRLTVAGFAALGVGLVAMVVLHATSGLNPLTAVISLHLYTPLGWLLPTSLGLFASGACLFAFASRRTAAPRWIMPALLTWAGFLTLVAVFPTDPPGLPEVSLISAIHRYAAFCAFVTLAATGLCFDRWAKRSEVPVAANARRTVVVCSWIAVSALVICSAPYVAEWFGVPREPGAFAAGLTQRLTVGSEVVTLAVVGFWLRSVPALFLGSRPSTARLSVAAFDVAQAPVDLGDRVRLPVVAFGRHLGAGERLGNAVGADAVGGLLVPAGFAVPQQLEAGELLEVEAVVEGERAAGGLVPRELVAAGRNVN